MSAKKWAVYHGTNPVVRVGGSVNALRKQDSALGSQSRGSTALAGSTWAKSHEFAPNIAWDLNVGAFVRRASRMELENFINTQRIDLFGRLLRRKHDLFFSNPTDDLEWAVMFPETTDIDTESVVPAYPVATGQNEEDIVLADLSYWNQESPKYGTWQLYNGTEDDSYAHNVPTTSTHANMSTDTTFTFMGWVKSTSSTAQQFIFRKTGNYVLAIIANVLTFTWRGATPVSFSSYTFPLATNRWYFVAISVTGTTINLYVGGDWETSLTNVADTIGGVIGGNNNNPLYVGSNAGDDCFIGYLGPMVFTNTLVSGANIEAQFDRTKVGQVMFTDTSDSIYGGPTKALYWDMQRRRSFEALTNLMVTKVYNTFAGNATPTDGAILLDHDTFARTDYASLFYDTALRNGLGDRLFLGPIDSYTDDVNYLDSAELVFIRQKDVGTADANQTRRIKIMPVSLADANPGGFRANHLNGQSVVRKFAQRWPRAVCLDIIPEQVDSLARGMLREITYGFKFDPPPFLRNTEQNYSNTLDLWYSVYRP